MSEHIPIEVPLIDRDKAELVRIVGRLKEELTWYVGERNRLIAAVPVAPSRSAAPNKVQAVGAEEASPSTDGCSLHPLQPEQFPASAAPPSEREAAILDYIVTVTGPTGGWLVSPKDVSNKIAELAARAAVPQAAEDEATEARWQRRIYDLCREAVGPELADTIDGSGCDSGDALDVTVSEIKQAIGIVRGAAAVPAPGEDDNFIKKVVHFRASCITGSECQDALQELANEAERILRAGATAPPKEG